MGRVVVAAGGGAPLQPHPAQERGVLRGGHGLVQAAPLIGLAATGLSAAGSMVGASHAAAGDRMEAQNAADAAQIGQTKAAETDADMRRRLFEAQRKSKQGTYHPRRATHLLRPRCARLFV